MLTDQEIEQRKAEAKTGALTGYASDRWKYAQHLLLDHNELS